MRMMVVCGLVFGFSTSAVGQAREPMIPSILKEPADWRFEKMPIPPGFAPDVKVNGMEEVRFAPGVFDNTSPNYFTYVLVLAAEGSPDLSAAGIRDFLEKYYRGLSVAVGRGRGMSPDSSQMTAEVMPAASGGKDRYNAKVIFFDSFTDGRKITLNIEAHVTPRPASGKSYLTLLISTQPHDNAIWEKLRGIEGKLSLD